MKSTRSGWMLIPLLCAAFLLSCSTVDDDEMKKRQMEMRSELENSIAETEAAIDRVERDIEAASEEMKEGLETKLSRLEDSRDELRDALDKMGGITAEEWDEFQRSVRRVVDNAKETLREV